MNSKKDVVFVIVVQYIVVALRFFIEIFMLGAFMYWGFHIDKGMLIKVLLGIGSPLLMAIIWGAFIAPKASFPVSVPVGVILQIIIFGLAGAALYFSGKQTIAVIFLADSTNRHDFIVCT